MRIEGLGGLEEMVRKLCPALPYVYRKLPAKPSSN